MSASSPYEPPQVIPPVESGTVSDNDAVRTLSWLYYVYAAFEAIVGLICFVMLLQASAALSRATSRVPVERGLPRMPNLSGVFDSMLIYVTLVVVIGVIVHILCGWYLRRRIKYVFCVAVAVVTCLSFPVGTLLGASSLLVLMRPGVKASFSPPVGGLRGE